MKSQTRQFILAASVAAIFSAGAQAQSSNVQIYGSIDMGFSHRSDNLRDNVGSQSRIDSGISSGSRLGFKGTEDLGNGLKVLFTLEAGYSADTGTSGQGGRLFGRQVFAGLTGGFGTVLAGRLYAPHYSLMSAIDPFKRGMVGQHNNVLAAGVTVSGSPGSINLFDPDRVDNAVAYVTPSWSGFSLTAAYSNNAIGQEATGNTGDNRVFALMPRYTNGPLDIGFSYHRIKSEDSDAVKVNNWTLAGAYDFGPVKLAAAYEQSRWNDVLGVDGDDLKLKAWLLGVTVPFGKHAFLASYNQSKLDWSDDSGKGRQIALGYTYALSKRTNLFAAIADTHNDKSRQAAPVKTGGSAVVAAGDGAYAGDRYQNGFQFGVRHTF
ncbi:MAG: porin [Zoogloeaceae bacterium]|jgi:predicted porin|nr:porin [Zoogloeaceae bacterium]